jgi:hypothetical protein
MDLELKDLGQTLVMGGFGIYGLLQLRNRHTKRAINIQDPNKRTSVAGEGVTWSTFKKDALYVAMAFAIGVFLEDFSKDIAAEHDGFSRREEGNRLTRAMNSAIDWALSSNRELRFRSLFEWTPVDKDNTNNIPCDAVMVKPTFLYFNLVPYLLEDTNTFFHYEALTNALVKNGNYCYLPHSERENVKDHINALYYISKNRVFREDTYYSELRGIDERVSFTRAFIFTCGFFVLVYPIVLVVSYFDPNALKDKKRLARMLLISILGLFLARTSYRNEQRQFNERVFGYYASLKADPSETAHGADEKKHDQL